MLRLPILRPKELVRIVERQGFVQDRQSGSHAIFIHPDGRWASIPIHNKPLGKGLLRKILRDIQIRPEEIKNR